MEKLFIYDWSVATDQDSTTIYIYGLTPDSESCCLIVPDFTPRIFIELPLNVSWNTGKILTLEKYLIQKRIFIQAPVHRTKTKRQKLYYVRYDKETRKPIRYPFLLYRFNTSLGFSMISSKLRQPLLVHGIGKIKITAHESNISVENQFMCERDIPSAGWIEFSGRKVRSEVKRTSCVHEYVVQSADISSTDFSKHVSPMMLSFDIETNSNNPNVVPSPKNPADCIFQISCVYWNPIANIQKEFLLTLGNPDCKIIGDHVETRTYRNEMMMIRDFVQLVHDYNPCLITGYNILGFDLPYLIGRAAFNKLTPTFCKMGMQIGKLCEIKDTKTKTGMPQQLLLSDGRIWIDLLHMAQRDFKLSNYKLDTVAEKFLGANKDPVGYQDIFRAYREGVKNPTEEGVKLLSTVGAYCVKDAVLVKDLFQKWDVWTSVMEMANVCSVAPSTVFTMGQQSKVFAQVYRYCFQHEIVIDNTKEMEFEELDYTGALVIDPVPGIYENVVPFDFSSLYPSIIIAYNIDYSTLVPDDMIIDDEKCHIIEWEEHIKCEHCEDTDLESREYRCSRFYYRFLKEPLGVLPTIIQNLLDLRKKTKKHMKELKQQLYEIEDETKRKEAELTVSLLDKRQLSYKISANSMYGALGSKPSKAVLPFAEGAMCITAMGRKNLMKAANHMQTKYKAHLVYGDTDSNYVQLPNITDRDELWKRCEEITREIQEDRVFPKPMKLDFEEAIYTDFLILKKKKYLWKKYDPVTKTVPDEIGKKGVLTARRDNSEFIRCLYDDLVKFAFDRETENTTIMYILEYLRDCLTQCKPQSIFVVTKSVKNASEYKVKPLPRDPEKRAKRLADLNCTEETYPLRCLPAHVQLAAKMRTRGVRVDASQRIEYVITLAPGLSDKLFDKIEDREYQEKYSSVVKIDYMYYIKQLCPPLDQLLEISFKKPKIFTKQFKIIQHYHKVIEQIESLTKPELVFKDYPKHNEQVQSKTQ